MKNFKILFFFYFDNRLFKEKIQSSNLLLKNFSNMNHLNKLGNLILITQFFFIDIKRILCYYYSSFFVILQLSYYRFFFTNFHIFRLFKYNKNYRYINWSFFKNINYSINTVKEKTVLICKSTIIYSLPLFLLSFQSRINFPISISDINYIFNQNLNEKYIQIKKKYMYIDSSYLQKKQKSFINNSNLYELDNKSKSYVKSNNKKYILNKLFKYNKNQSFQNLKKNTNVNYKSLKKEFKLYLNSCVTKLYPLTQTQFWLFTLKSTIRKYSDIDRQFYKNKKKTDYNHKNSKFLKTFNINKPFYPIELSNKEKQKHFKQLYCLNNLQNKKNILIDNTSLYLICNFIDNYQSIYNININFSELNYEIIQQKNLDINKNKQKKSLLMALISIKKRLNELGKLLYIFKKNICNLFLLIYKDSLYHKNKLLELKLIYFSYENNLFLKKSSDLEIYTKFKNFFINIIIYFKKLFINNSNILYIYNPLFRFLSIKELYFPMYSIDWNIYKNKNYNKTELIYSFFQNPKIISSSFHFDYVKEPILLHNLYKDITYKMNFKKDFLTFNKFFNIVDITKILIDELSLFLLSNNIEFRKVQNNFEKLSIFSISNDKKKKSFPKYKYINNISDNLTIESSKNLDNLILRNFFPNQNNQKKDVLITKQISDKQALYNDTYFFNYFDLLKYSVFKEYHKWLFTWQWFKFYIKILYYTIHIVWSDVVSNIEDLFLNKSDMVIDNLSIIKTTTQKTIFNNKFSIYDKFNINFNLILGLKDYFNWSTILNKKKYIYNNSINTFIYITLIWLMLFYNLYICNIYTFFGLSQIFLWNEWKINKSFKEADWNTIIKLSILNNIGIQHKKKETFFHNFSYISFIRYKYYLLWIKKNTIKYLITNYKINDIFKEKQSFILNSLISNDSLIDFFQNTPKYIETNILCRNLSIYKEEGKEYIERYINGIYNNFFVINNQLSKNINLKTLEFLPFNKKYYIGNIHKKTIPIHLYLPSISSFQTLIIGTEEICKGFILQKIALEFGIPVIQLSINNIINGILDINKNDIIKTIKNKKEKLKILIDLLLNIGPCILWIPHFDKINDNSISQNHNNQFIIRRMVLSFIDQLLKRKNNYNISLIVTTNKPNLIDPTFFSLTRLNSIININSIDFIEKTNNLNNLFYFIKNNSKKKKNLTTSFRSTFLYDVEDKLNLINEINLLNISKGNTLSDIVKFKLAIERQILLILDKNISHLHLDSDNMKIFYSIKIFTDIVLKKIYPIEFIDIFNKLWKTRYYNKYKINNFQNIFNSSNKFNQSFKNIIDSIGQFAERDVNLILKNNTSKLFLLNNQDNMDINILWMFILNNFSYKLKHFKTFQETKQTSKILQYIKNHIYKTKNNQVNSMSKNGYKFLLNDISSFFIEIHSNVNKQNHDMLQKQIIKNKYKNYLSSEDTLHIYNSYPRILNKTQEIQSKYMNLKYMNRKYLTQKNQNQTQIFKNQKATNNLYFLFKKNIFFKNQELLLSFRTFQNMYTIYGLKKQRDSFMSVLTRKKMFLEQEKELFVSKIKKYMNINEKIDITNIRYFRLLTNSSIQLKQPQLYCPIYLYQSWLLYYPQDIQNIKYKTRLTNNKKVTESQISMFIIECYNFLLNLILLNNNILKKNTIQIGKNSN